MPGLTRLWPDPLREGSLQVVFRHVRCLEDVSKPLRTFQCMIRPAEIWLRGTLPAKSELCLWPSARAFCPMPAMPSKAPGTWTAWPYGPRLEGSCGTCWWPHGLRHAGRYDQHPSATWAETFGGCEESVSTLELPLEDQQLHPKVCQRASTDGIRMPLGSALRWITFFILLLIGGLLMAASMASLPMLLLAPQKLLGHQGHHCGGCRGSHWSSPRAPAVSWELCAP